MFDNIQIVFYFRKNRKREDRYMLKRISDFFAGVKMTAVSGVCLAASLVMLLADVNPILDPAWITVVLSG